MFFPVFCVSVSFWEFLLVTLCPYHTYFYTYPTETDWDTQRVFPESCETIPLDDEPPWTEVVKDHPSFF